MQPLSVPSHTTRQQAFARNFLPYFAGKTPPQVTTLPVADLVAMLAADNVADRKRFAVVSKPCSRDASRRHVTTVLDVSEGKLYRATHAGGMVSFWRGLAKRRAAVTFVPAQEDFSSP